MGRSEGQSVRPPLKIARTMLQEWRDRNTVMKMTGLTEDNRHKSATKSPFAALPAGPSVKTGRGRSIRLKLQPASHSDLTSFIIPVCSLSDVLSADLSVGHCRSSGIKVCP